MKKILFALLLSVPLLGQSYVLTTDYDNGSFISDSLFFTYVDTSATPDDTTASVTYKQFVNKYRYNWAVITLIDTGTVQTDTIRLQYSDPSGVNWSDMHLVRDSTWTSITQPLADNSSVRSFMAYIEPYWKFRVYMSNATVVENLVHYFKIQLLRSKPQF